MRLLIGGTPTGTLKHIDKTTYRQHCGMLTSWADGSHPKHALRLNAPWAMDNFAFTQFDAVKYKQSLVKFSGIPNCLFVTAPDVVRDANATAALFDQWVDAIKCHGYPVALVAQNGLESIPIDWNAIDAIFVGGDNEFKYSSFVVELVHEARIRRKWTHMGRVNTRGRWRYCAGVGFDSCDGTGLVIERKRIKEAIEAITNPQRPMYQWKPTFTLEE